MTSIIAQHHAQSPGGSSWSINITAAPLAGDVVYIAILGNRAAAPRTITSVSGIGGTWAQAYNSGDSRFVIYRGTGASASGAVTVTFSGTQTAALAAWVVRGTGASTAVAALASGSGTSLVGPSQAADSGQVVLAIGIGSSTSFVFPSNQTPAGAFTTAPGGTLSGSARAAPTTPAAHHVEATQTTSAGLHIGQVVVGEAVSTTPTRTAALYGTGSFSAVATVVSPVPVANGTVQGEGSFAAVASLVTERPVVSGTVQGEGHFSAVAYDAARASVSDTNDRVAGRARSGYGVATWYPPVVPPPFSSGWYVGG